MPKRIVEDCEVVTEGSPGFRIAAVCGAWNQSLVRPHALQLRRRAALATVPRVLQEGREAVPSDG